MRLGTLLRILLVLPILLVGLAGSSDAKTWNVNVRGAEPDGPFRFAPDTLQIAYGDTVRWVWVEGSHTTTEFDGNQCTGGAGLWNALVDEFNPTFTVVFNQSLLPPGNATILYECGFHCFLGMDGVIFITATGIETYLPGPEPRVTEYTWGRLKAKVIWEPPR